MQQLNQEMPTFDVSSIPSEFNPLVSHTLDDQSRAALYKDDPKLFIQFKTEAVLNPAASTKEGRPIYDDIDMIVIRTPGSQLTSIVSPVKYYMDRFGDQYRKWKDTQVQAVSGTPLEAWPFLMIKPSLIAELKYRNVFSVEQLATLSDTAKGTIMGGQELSRQAAKWIADSKGLADSNEKQALLDRIALLESMMNAPKQENPAPTKGK